MEGRTVRRSIRQQRMRGAWRAAVVGLCSGLISQVALWGLAGTSQTSGMMIGLLFSLTPGLAFGLGIGLYHVQPWLGASTARVIAFVLLVTAAWAVACTFAVEAQNGLGLGLRNRYEVGSIAGALGGLGVAAATAALFPVYRRPLLLVATGLVGAAAGTLLGWGDVNSHLLPLFVVWQAAVGACIGYGLATQRPGARQISAA